MILKLEVLTNNGPVTAQSIHGLPDFVIITGLNGSGKSTLLRAIESRKAKLTDSVGKALSVISIVDGFTMSRVEGGVDRTGIHHWGLLEDAEGLRTQLLNDPNALKFFGEEKTDYWKRQLSDIGMMFSVENFGIETHHLISRALMCSLEHDNSNDFTATFKTLDLKPIVRDFLIRNFQKNVRLDFLKISDDYAHKIAQNDYKIYLEKIGRKVVERPLTAEQFENKYGRAPWAIGNELFEMWGLDLIRTMPVGCLEGVTRVPASICQKSSGIAVTPNALSSGEQTLLSLLSTVYRASILGSMPEVMLFDEPDAILNPALSKSLINILKDVVCSEFGVKVIMTSHSPTTVAAAPTGSHYLMEVPSRILKKSSKEEAIAQLFIGTPELTLLTEKTKQVFCESELDALCYRSLFRICQANHADRLNAGNLNFMAYGKTSDQRNNANRQQVEELVSKLVGSGNPIVRGLVDWDRSGAGEKPGVVISSKGLRYAKENTVFDPLFLGLYILKQKFDPTQKLKQSVGMPFSDFTNWTEKDRQVLVDEVCVAVEANFANHGVEGGEMNTVSYSDGKNARVPCFWMLADPHDLVSAILSTFPMLKAKHLDDLCCEVIEHVNVDTKVVLDETIETFNKLLD